MYQKNLKKEKNREKSKKEEKEVHIENILKTKKKEL